MQPRDVNFPDQGVVIIRARVKWNPQDAFIEYEIHRASDGQETWMTVTDPHANPPPPPPDPPGKGMPTPRDVNFPG